MKSLKNVVLAALISLAITLVSPLRAEVPQEIDIADAVQALADGLASGQQATARFLVGLGNDSLTAAVERIESIDGFRYPGFSARAMIEELYLLAEAAEAGGGGRFIAFLYKPLAEVSAAFANDPIMDQFKSRSSEVPLKFADPAVVGTLIGQTELPQNVRQAIQLVAEAAVGAERFHSVVGIATRTLRLPQPPSPERRVREAVVKSTTAIEALNAIVGAHAPPPLLAAAMQRFVVDVAESSAALSDDPRIAAVLRALADAPIPPSMVDLIRAAPNLSSQRQQIGRTKDTSRATFSAENTFSRVLEQAGVESVAPTIGGTGERSVEPLRQDYDRYVSATMAPRAPEFAPQVSSENSRSTSGGPGGSGTPRAFETARLSAKAGRGVSVGAVILWPDTPAEAAAWVESAVDPRFGRFVVATASGIFASQPLFSDSASAAMSTIWGEHGIEAEFRDGDILILVSLDPTGANDHPDIQPMQDEASKKANRIVESNAQIFPLETRHAVAKLIGEDIQANILASSPMFDRVVADRLFDTLASVLADLPRRLVVHPAAHGLELAWAAGRVDFWPSRGSELEDELKLLSAFDAQLAKQLSDFPQPADTWQFYERQGAITIRFGEPWGALEVESKVASAAGTPAVRNHFSVTLFAVGERPQGRHEPTEDPQIWRLPEESANADNLLDRLFVSHPDFARLNHYAEALALVRWIERTGAPMAIYDGLGTSRDIPSPRWVLTDRTLAVKIPTRVRR